MAKQAGRDKGFQGLPQEVQNIIFCFIVTFEGSTTISSTREIADKHWIHHLRTCSRYGEDALPYLPNNGFRALSIHSRHERLPNGTEAIDQGWGDAYGFCVDFKTSHRTRLTVPPSVLRYRLVSRKWSAMLASLFWTDNNFLFRGVEHAANVLQKAIMSAKEEHRAGVQQLDATGKAKRAFDSGWLYAITHIARAELWFNSADAASFGTLFTSLRNLVNLDIFVGLDGPTVQWPPRLHPGHLVGAPGKRFEDAIGFQELLYELRSITTLTSINLIGRNSEIIEPHFLGDISRAQIKPFYIIGQPSDSETYLTKKAIGTRFLPNGQYAVHTSDVIRAINAKWANEWTRDWVEDWIAHLRLDASQYHLLAYIALVLEARPRSVLQIMNKVHGLRLISARETLAGGNRKVLAKASMGITDDDLLLTIEYIRELRAGTQFKNEPFGKGLLQKARLKSNKYGRLVSDKEEDEALYTDLKGNILASTPGRSLGVARVPKSDEYSLIKRWQARLPARKDKYVIKYTIEAERQISATLSSLASKSTASKHRASSIRVSSPGDRSDFNETAAASAADEAGEGLGMPEKGSITHIRGVSAERGSATPAKRTFAKDETAKETSTKRQRMSEPETTPTDKNRHSAATSSDDSYTRGRKAHTLVGGDLASAGIMSETHRDRAEDHTKRMEGAGGVDVDVEGAKVADDSKCGTETRNSVTVRSESLSLAENVMRSEDTARRMVDEMDHITPPMPGTFTHEPDDDLPGQDDLNEQTTTQIFTARAIPLAEAQVGAGPEGAPDEARTRITKVSSWVFSRAAAVGRRLKRSG